MQNISRIFICYRQVDGKETAHWLYKNLHGRLLPDSINLGEEPSVLDVYFDQATPAIGNWQELHRPYLEASRAMLVICTPGIFSRLNSDDWVHKEIEWWLENRSAAPIIIDSLSNVYPEFILTVGSGLYYFSEFVMFSGH